MSISPISAPLVPNYKPPTPPATPAAPQESLLHKAEHGVADVMDLVGKVPFLEHLGVTIYGLLMGKPKAGSPDLSNTGMVADNLERGAQPTEAGFAKLKAQGVNTIVNLRPESTWEQAVCQKLGLKYVYLPEPPIGPPTLQEGVQFLSTATDPANGNVFFHCQHGADRTGAMAAIYRITVDGWTPQQAIAEMPQYGFHAGIEDEKVNFVNKFAAYWQTLPATQKAQILHQNAPQTAAKN
ncbi:MAG TPA: sulfur transferase domain-containing protein [Oscillatoriaceae cyanobacterium]